MKRGRDGGTMDIFAVPEPAAPLPASMNYRQEVAVLVAQVLKNAVGDRYDVAARMSRLSGNEVSKYMLDAWASEAREAYNLPFYQAAVLEAACDTHALTQWLATKRGARVLVGREALTAELGKLERLRDEAGKKIRELKRVMEELE